MVPHFAHGRARDSLVRGPNAASCSAIRSRSFPRTISRADATACAVVDDVEVDNKDDDDDEDDDDDDVDIKRR